MTHHAAPLLLSLRHIVKRFGHHAAVNDVSLDVWPGQIVALQGENGADNLYCSCEEGGVLSAGGDAGAYRHSGAGI